MRWTAATLLVLVSVDLGAMAFADSIPAPASPRSVAAPPTIDVVRPETTRVSIVQPKTIPVSLPKKPFPDPAWGLIGVLIGALVGEGLRRWQEQRRIARLKTALRDECRSLLNQVPMFIDICQKMIATLQRKRVLPGSPVRGIRTIYQANIAELAPLLTLRERNLLHVVHERMRVAEELMAAHLADVRDEVRGGHVADPWAPAITSGMSEGVQAVKRTSSEMSAGVESGAGEAEPLSTPLPTHDDKSETAPYDGPLEIPGRWDAGGSSPADALAASNSPCPACGHQVPGPYLTLEPPVLICTGPGHHQFTLQGVPIPNPLGMCATVAVGAVS